MIKHKQREARGQSIVEFAFAFPFLLFCLVAIIYFGKAFFTIQILANAAQEGARAASRTPSLEDPATRDALRGFSTTGSAINPGSIIYASLGAANLLSNGRTGDLPPGTSIHILPWDSDGTAADSVPPGTIGVRLQYPFSLLINPFTGKSTSSVTLVSIPLSLDRNAQPVTMPDFAMSEKATVSQEVYQEGN